MGSTALRLSSLESPPSGALPPDRERAIRELLEGVARDTLETERSRRWRPPWKRPGRTLVRAGLATATAAVLMAISLVTANVLAPDTELAHAATPALTGHETAEGEPATAILHQLARQAEAQPSVDHDGNTTIRTERWSLAITVDAGEKAEGRAASSDDSGAALSVTTAVIPVLRDLTRHPDGSVRIREVEGEAQFPNDAYRRAWNEQGQPGAQGRVIRDETLPAGALPERFPAELPAAPDKLLAILAADRPAVKHDAGELLLAVHDLRRQRLLGGAVRTALFELLADRPGIVSLGTTTDRAGREALAVAADSDHSGWPNRHILLLDPDDSRILGYERVLTGDVDKLDVTAPAIVDYTVFR